MAGLSEQLSQFASALNVLPSDLAADMNSMAAGPLSEMTKQMMVQMSQGNMGNAANFANMMQANKATLAGMANLANVSNVSTKAGSESLDVSFDCDMTPEGLSKAMLAIAETFLQSTDNPMAGAAVSMGMGMGVGIAAASVPISASQLRNAAANASGGKPEFQFQMDSTTGNAVFTAVLGNNANGAPTVVPVPLGSQPSSDAQSRVPKVGGTRGN
ncbi:hypothetical protein HDU99_010786, partial [Rhizoclosmatium hyalinum]